LESSPAPSLTAFSNQKPAEDIARFEAKFDKTNRRIKLTWSDNLKNVRMYEIYKNVDGQPPTLWKTVYAPIHEIADENIRQGSYLYMLRAIFNTGKNSKTKSVTIKF
jgi:hypothetical protein